MPDRIIILLPSRPDPESEAIRALADQCGIPTAQTWAEAEAHGGVILAVEREDWPATVPDRVVRIDHHAPGDPGYGRPPAEYLPASSLGQVVAELARLAALRDVAWPADACDEAPESGLAWTGTDWVVRVEATWDQPCGPHCCGSVGGSRYIPTEILLVAAADHCLGAAYRGECPGVDPDELVRWRAESRAQYQRRPVAELLADLAATTEALCLAPRLTLAEGLEPVADMRRDTPWPELPDAAARLGVGYVSGPLIGPDRRPKWTCSGTAEQVAAWMREWAPAQRIVGIYGDPVRGFAGGYTDWRDSWTAS